MLAKTIEGVAQQLGQTIARCAASNDRRGYFAALLAKTTAQVDADLRQGLFQRPTLVEKVHVACTNRYLSAIRAWDQRRSMSHAWQAAFRYSESRGGTVAQNLRMAYQIHHGIDRGVALASVLNRAELNDFHQDFQRLEALLEAHLEASYTAVTRDWQWYQLACKTIFPNNTTLIALDHAKMREEAWDFARRLSLKDRDDRDDPIDQRDAACAAECRSIAAPGFPTSIANALLQRLEVGTVASIIAALRQGEAPLADLRSAISGAA